MSPMMPPTPFAISINAPELRWKRALLGAVSSVSSSLSAGASGGETTLIAPHDPPAQTGCVELMASDFACVVTEVSPGQCSMSVRRWTCRKTEYISLAGEVAEDSAFRKPASTVSDSAETRLSRALRGMRPSERLVFAHAAAKCTAEAAVCMVT